MQLSLEFPFTLTQEKYMYFYLLEKITTLLIVFNPSLQDLMGNSPYCLSYSSYGVSSRNLVLDQLIIP